MLWLHLIFTGSALCSSEEPGLWSQTGWGLNLNLVLLFISCMLGLVRVIVLSLGDFIYKMGIIILSSNMYVMKIK